MNRRNHPPDRADLAWLKAKAKNLRRHMVAMAAGRGQGYLGQGLGMADILQAEQDLIRNHPLMQGVPNLDQIANRGRSGHGGMVASPNLLFHSGQTADNTPHLFAVDKRTGRRVGQIEIPAQSRYGMSSWEHNGHQVILVQLPDGLAAFGLPAAVPQAGAAH